MAESGYIRGSERARDNMGIFVFRVGKHFTRTLYPTGENRKDKEFSIPPAVCYLILLLCSDLSGTAAFGDNPGVFQTWGNYC